MLPNSKSVCVYIYICCVIFEYIAVSLTIFKVFEYIAIYCITYIYIYIYMYNIHMNFLRVAYKELHLDRDLFWGSGFLAKASRKLRESYFFWFLVFLGRLTIGGLKCGPCIEKLFTLHQQKKRSLSECGVYGSFIYTYIYRHIFICATYGLYGMYSV